MSGGPTRRSLLQSAGLAATAGLAGCQRLVGLFPESRRGTAPQSTGGPITGSVTDTDGTAVRDASVAAIDGAGDQRAVATTDDDGAFSLPVSRPVWVSVRATGFKQRTVAARPGQSVDVVVVEEAGTAALSFGGDVMFGRRFYREPTDNLAPHHRIRPAQRRDDHERVVTPISPLLSSADITSVNLESPLTTTSVRHPNKTYTFTSHPVAAEALADAGVSYAALGNNHAFDALGPGLDDTTGTLDDAGIAHSGAGRSPEAAWDPVTETVSGVTVAMLSCSDIVGIGDDPHWSADRAEGRPRTVTVDGTEYEVPVGAGVAEATADRLHERVASAADDADVVVVQIHGGTQYRRRPTERMVGLTDAAIAAGADLVVNHHPHVVGGIERRNGAVVAWSMGNLVFDQTVWETFPSYLLTAYVTTEGVVRTVADPLLVEGFVPYGVVGKPNRLLRHRTAGRSGAAVRLTDTGVALGRGNPAPSRTTRTLDAPGLYERRSGSVASAPPSVTLGRDLLPTGTFESDDIDDTGHDGTLWRYSRSPSASAPAFGVDGSGGVMLRRIAGNSKNVLLSNRRRIPISGRPLTLLARYLTDVEAGCSLEVAWYPDRRNPSLERESWSLTDSGSQWTLHRQSLTPPDGASHVNVLFVMSAPNTGRRTAYLDDIRLVEWADEATGGGPEFGFLRAAERATVEFSDPARGDGVDWRRVDGP